MRERTNPDIGFDADRSRKLLAPDEKKRLALIELLVEERAKERLDAEFTSERDVMTAATIAKVLGKREA